MKKTYINPSMKVRDMKVRNHFLMASNLGMYDKNATSVLSRDADYYYDEEEDW